MIVALYASTGTVNPRVFTGDTEDGEHGIAGLRFKWKYYEPADTPYDITIDMNDSGGDNCLMGVLLELVL